MPYKGTRPHCAGRRRGPVFCSHLVPAKALEIRPKNRLFQNSKRAIPMRIITLSIQ